MIRGGRGKMSTDTYVMIRLREREDFESDDMSVIGVYDSMEKVETRLKSIQRANPKYGLMKVGSTMWRIGPEEDEGFFGDHVYYIQLRKLDRKFVKVEDPEVERLKDVVKFFLGTCGWVSQNEQFSIECACGNRMIATDELFQTIQTVVNEMDEQ